MLFQWIWFFFGYTWSSHLPQALWLIMTASHRCQRLPREVRGTGLSLLYPMQTMPWAIRSLKHKSKNSNPLKLLIISSTARQGVSVLTRILPWGVPGPPLLRNRGPVRTLGGQSYKKHAVRRTWARTPNCLLHEVPTWSNMAEEVFTIRRRSLRCSGTCVGPMKVKATKLKTLTHLISCFLFIQTNRMLAHVP